jgi:hypothetical protein
MKESEAKKLTGGERIAVSDKSYTAFNGQQGTFLTLTGTHKTYGRLAKVTIYGSDRETVAELPIETFYKL